MFHFSFIIDYVRYLINACCLETETEDACTGNAINGKYVEALDTFYSHRDMITARREAVAIVLKRIRNMEQVLRFIIFVYQQKFPLV